MEIIKTIKELKNKTIDFQRDTTIGFVPTMGALHDGHISLINRSKIENDITIVSIFVNPTQFLQGEDLSKYPRTIEEDLKKCEVKGVDLVFLPEISTMYGKDEVLIKAPNLRSYTLEGERRPEHFDGVLQIVLKLFNLVQPTNAYFGKKDAQQLSMISTMVENLFLDINIVPCEIIRENDGLAMSSRNIYLSENERKNALSLSKSLFLAKDMIDSGEFKTDTLKEKMSDTLKNIDLEYVEIVDTAFNKIEKIEKNNSIILVAAKVGTTRLIDNIWI